MKMIDIEAVRNDTPASKNLIHFNNAGASLPPEPVLNGVIAYLKEEAEIGGYEAEAKYSAHFAQTYHSIAKLINCKASEIALVESATRAWDVALASIPFHPGDIILTTQTEYISNYIVLLQIQKRYQVKLEIISNDPHGQFSLEELEKKMSPKVKLVALTHVPSTNGLVNPIEAAATLIKKHNAYFLLDACQSIGQLSIDVQKIGCDFLAATGRKFLRAPRGTGFLFAKEAAVKGLEPQFLDFSSAALDNDHYNMVTDAKKYENYETSFAARFGLGLAVDYLLRIGQDAAELRIQNLAYLLRQELEQIKGVTLLDTGVQKSGIVTFAFNGVDSRMVAMELRKNKMNVSTAYPGFALELQKRQITSLLRASVHYYNTEDEIKGFVNYLSHSNFSKMLS